jgi:uncharacterized protein (TIGR03437 family)
MHRGSFVTARMPVFLLLLGAGSIAAQSIVCATSALPPLVRAEGLTERIGDILLTCTGTPGNTVNANITIGLNTGVTNRISSASTLTGIVFTIDSGAGPQPVLTQPLLFAQTALSYYGVNIPFSPQGAVSLRFVGIRANATHIPVGLQIVASISVNTAGLGLTSAKVTVGTPQRALYVSYGDALVCAQWGSPLPGTITFSNLIAQGTALANTRVTEGFADAFQPLSNWENFNADSGERILVQYSGFPDDARLFVPDVIAGSDALQPTSGGGFGLPVSGGMYSSSAEGSLLLARVAGADASGAGGSPVYVPGAIGSAAVALDSVSQIPVLNGSAYAVYEVVDANPSAIESAQYPTFLGLLPDGSRLPTIASEQVFFAPSSTAGVATTSDPLPRFAPVTALPDCAIAGGCDPTPPKLTSDTTSLQFTEQVGGGYQSANVAIANSGGGSMQWVASVSYNGGSAWLSVSPSKGVNNGTLQTAALAYKLAPGVYTATLTINAGAVAGALTIPATLTITSPPAPAISSVLNAASLLAEPVVPGSITTVMGTLFGGTSVSAAFNNLPATILFSNDTQLNVVVPSDLTGQTSAQLLVTVDGDASAPTTVSVAPFEPGIFSGGIENQDTSVNSVTNGAAPGSIIAMWATGLSGTGSITANIGGEDILVPNYAGPAPGLIGVQQVNLIVPTDLAPGVTQVYVCGTAAGASKICSIPAPLTIH